MTIAFFSNFLNHHQVFVADELYRQTGSNYVFVETIPMPEWIVKSGYPDYSTRPYIVQAWKGDDEMKKAKALSISADVALFAGFEVLEFEKIRIARTNKLTFDVSERWLKRGIVNVVSPRILRLFLAYHLGGWRRKPVYKLCSSAFAASDQLELCTYKNRCYKWGYFTSVPDEPIFRNKIASDQVIRIMWCARFLWWKHPELTIQLAARLKADGYKFVIDVFGTGEKSDEIKALASKLQVENFVMFKGNKPNHEILQEMHNHDIFILTSDKNEGWGAVANEAMSQGCMVIGSDEIGSIPYLVKDGETGLLFKSRSIDSLYEKVKWSLDNPSEISRIANKGMQNMIDNWSPKVAAQNLIRLIILLSEDKDTDIMDGPCSKA